MAVYPDIITEVPGTIPFEHRIEQRALITEFENGSEQRRGIDAFPKRYVKLQYNNIPYDNAQILLNFYTSMHGTLDSFTFVYPQLSTFSNELAGTVDIGGQINLTMPSVGAINFSLRRNGVIMSPSEYDISHSVPDTVILQSPANIGDIYHWSFTGRLSITARFAVGPVPFSDIKAFNSSVFIDLVSLQNYIV